MAHSAEPDASGERFTIAGLPTPESQTLPDAMAPLIFNAWYVIAKRAEVDRSLRAIKSLGQPLVYYRTEDGRPVVLDDRCAHRRFPLSKSKLIGDTIQCGYHGFTYDTTGRCVRAPGVNVQPRFGIRSYPCAELGPWLWVWMGDPDKADSAAIPFIDPFEIAPYGVTGYKLNPANYMLFIENILDMSHAHFLHEAASIEFALQPLQRFEVPGGVGFIQEMASMAISFMATWCGGNPEQLVQGRMTGRQLGPSFHFNLTENIPLPGDDQPVLPGKFCATHAITPMDERNTHQFFSVSIDKPLSIGEKQLLSICEGVVFEQDVTALGAMQRAIDEDRRSGQVEYSINSDRFGMAMRRILRDRKAEESAGR